MATQAAQAWLDLYREGKIRDYDAREGFLGIEDLYQSYTDGSILCWSTRENKWVFYNTLGEYFADKQLSRI